MSEPPPHHFPFPFPIPLTSVVALVVSFAFLTCSAVSKVFVLVASYGYARRLISIILH